MARITIFISHAHGESELAALLKERLVQDFIGRIDILFLPISRAFGAGEDWYSTTMNKVRIADKHLVLCSQDSGWDFCQACGRV